MTLPRWKALVAALPRDGTFEVVLHPGVDDPEAGRALPVGIRVGGGERGPRERRARRPPRVARSRDRPVLPPRVRLTGAAPSARMPRAASGVRRVVPTRSRCGRSGLDTVGFPRASPRHPLRGPREALRGRRRRRRSRPGGLPGRVLRPPRAERCREDDDDRDPRGAHLARRGRRRSPRGPLEPRRTRPPRAARHLPAGDAARRQAHGRGDAPPLPLLLPEGARPRGAPRHALPRREAPRPRREALRRAAPAPRRRLRPRRRAGAPLPRRADDRPRPAEPPRPLGPGGAVPGGRRDGPPHDALHGRGRAALRPRGDRRPREADRPRHAGGADRPAPRHERRRVRDRSRACRRSCSRPCRGSPRCTPPARDGPSA